MGDVLSKRQKKAAQKVSALHLGTLATVKRVSKTNNSTGTSSTSVLIYDQIPCHLAPISDTNPTVTTNENASTSLVQRAYGFFPLEWVDERVGGSPLSVQINRGDIIEVDGQKWRASSDQDPAQNFETRRRVTLANPHSEVVA